MLAWPALLSQTLGMQDPRPAPPFLVRPAHELRWLSRTWLALGILVLGADLASGSLLRLPDTALLGTLGLLGLSVFGSVAGMTLGVRSPPGSLYGRRFDRAPVPPPGVPVEVERLTAARAGWAAIVIALLLSVAAPVAVAAVLVLLGTATDAIPGDLPAAGGLEAAGWILACSVAARQLRRWVVHWETRRRRVLFCAALLSGRLAPVYYAAERVPAARTGFNAREEGTVS